MPLFTRVKNAFNVCQKLIHIFNYTLYTLCNFHTWSVPVLLGFMINTLMFRQWISRFELSSTKATRNRYPSNMMSLNVVYYSRYISFFSTHLAYLFSSTSLICIAEHHHWLHLLVQAFQICVVGCFFCESKHFFTCFLYDSIFKTYVLVQRKMIWCW